MLNLFAVREKQEQERQSGTSKSRQSSAQLRVSKDLNDLSLPKTCKLNIPNPDDLLNFQLTIKPDDGLYRNGKFLFSFSVSSSYPHEAPKVKCLQKIFHPNIDTDGNVCLNILREEWKPVLNISAVIYGLILLFTDPNAEDPLNKEAAELYVSNPIKFEACVHKSMRGGSIDGVRYDNVV